ncbi:MAG: GNAT family N-acetyltransferase [Candidatus Palauibacterales bacterium]|nr:GNAT family N-acetyltransferase [Candidatus Palauibacterales bacterium]MDP2529722.1 GNAT family N-acetyltransferase [Candidatus Palauibacterales bacterium]MDP2584433.1 GNAT family N-acetyltransferase [Candidatus Palauibacterales bacterium]
MRDETVLRKATLDDLDEVLALWSHYLRLHRDNPAYRLAKRGLEKRRETFRRHIEGSESAVFVLERPDGGLDGMVTCFAEENLPYFMPPRYARIQTPFVRPDARRRGNLKRLLTAALRWAREEEFMEIRLYTSAGSVMGNAIADELGFQAVEVVRRKPVDWRSPPEEQIQD